MRILLILISGLLSGLSTTVQGQSLAQRLGYGAEEKLLIVNGDDVGMSHSANAATIDAQENGIMTSGTIMVPCPWFEEIAAYAREHPESDFGIHLTHTNEWKSYKWGPVANARDVPGLVDASGYMWPDVPQVYQHATPEEAEIEARSQIEKALIGGIDVTHLDSHMGTLQYSDAFFQVYRRLANEFDLPIRMASQTTLEEFGGGHQRAQLTEDGILSPDYLIHGGPEDGEAVAVYWKRVLKSLQPGVTELYIHAALPGEEIEHITNSWKTRVVEHDLFTTDEEVRKIIRDEEIVLIGYREIRDLQRGD